LTFPKPQPWRWAVGDGSGFTVEISIIREGILQPETKIPSPMTILSPVSSKLQEMVLPCARLSRFGRLLLNPDEGNLMFNFPSLSKRSEKLYSFKSILSESSKYFASTRVPVKFADRSRTAPSEWPNKAYCHRHTFQGSHEQR
jgi:hypothetical protein